MGVLGLGPRVIGYNIQRSLNIPVLMPFNLTLSVTGRCNSRCRTCGIWKHSPEDMSFLEWQRILKDMGSSPEWITISGGEPFLREDLADIMKTVLKFNKPSYITVATNGILKDRILELARSVRHRRMIFNVSIDGTRELHNRIRGIDCFDKAIDTIKGLKNLGAIVGVHTVISKYNADKLSSLCALVDRLKPDSHICQIAEHRKELMNNPEIIPDEDTYKASLRDFKGRGKGVGRILRQIYYKQSRPRCFAGIASAHVNYNGDLWACCVRCETLGNLRKDTFRALWKSERAMNIRKRIKDEDCTCNLANASYSNTICDPTCIFL